MFRINMTRWLRGLAGPNVCPSSIAEGRWSKEERDESNQMEQIWGNWIIGDTDNGQWTTRLGENLVKCAYEKKGKKVWRPKCINRYRPDWETEDEIIEVKTRSWTTSGTAGEKVLGAPFKYSDVPRPIRETAEDCLCCLPGMGIGLWEHKSIWRRYFGGEKRDVGVVERVGNRVS